MPRAPFVVFWEAVGVDDALDDAELDEGEEPALPVVALPADAALSAVVMSMGNLMGLPPADMSTAPSALRVSGLEANNI